ncbi:MAG: PTS sugar transporter subunit IIA [Treponema sp.]|jgi:PTS system nitrogen regulatory IIA component|nr:PTS sugar transporter subunit IIA [Treponema sp.]
MEDAILTIDEVARYLRVSERTVYDWAQKGEIPSGKLGTVWRFKRSDIERWVNDKLSLNSGVYRTVMTVPIESLLSVERIILMECETKQEVLTTLTETISSVPQIKDRHELLQEILRREELMSTAVGRGIAFPHVRLFSITDLVVALGINAKGTTDFQALDEEPVRIICMIVAAYHQHTAYLQTLSLFNTRLRNPKLRESLINASSPLEVYHILVEKL